MRIVLDTNVLIDALNDDLSAGSRLVEAVIEGELTAISTPAVRREYQRILRRFTLNVRQQERMNDFIAATEVVPTAAVEVVLDDAEDYKFVQAAVGGAADLLVTNDHHLLDLGEIESTRVMRPHEAWTAWQEDMGTSSEWQSFTRGWGIGK